MPCPIPQLASGRGGDSNPGLRLKRCAPSRGCGAGAGAWPGRRCGGGGGAAGPRGVGGKAAGGPAALGGGAARTGRGAPACPPARRAGRGPGAATKGPPSRRPVPRGEQRSDPPLRPPAAPRSPRPASSLVSPALSGSLPVSPASPPQPARSARSSAWRGPRPTDRPADRLIPSPGEEQPVTMVTPAKAWTTWLCPLFVGVSRADTDVLCYDPQYLTAGLC